MGGKGYVEPEASSTLFGSTYVSSYWHNNFNWGSRGADSARPSIKYVYAVGMPIGCAEKVCTMFSRNKYKYTQCGMVVEKAWNHEKQRQKASARAARVSEKSEWKRQKQDHKNARKAARFRQKEERKQERRLQKGERKRQRRNRRSWRFRWP